MIPKIILNSSSFSLNKDKMKHNHAHWVIFMAALCYNVNLEKVKQK
jgi:hypothetical protein